MVMERFNPVQQSFYEPYVINGVRIWFDSVRKIENVVAQDHGKCLPDKDVRFGLQDATLPISPEPLRPWYPNADNVIDVRDAYQGDDVWMGPYYGAHLHAGLDINMPVGTPLWAPMDFDEQFYFDSLARGDNNNRWRGIRRWDNGERWVLQAHHLTELLVPEHTPLKQGAHYAEAAGTLTGMHAHTHFQFAIGEEDERIWIDPWILFWQIFENNKERAAMIRARMTPLAPARTGEAVAFSAEDSTAGVTGNNLSYRWAFGDGGSAVGPTPEHTYAKPGVYPVTLFVDDGAEQTETTQHITVNGEAIDQPALALHADEVSFIVRPVGAMDTYGLERPVEPHSLRMIMHPQHNPTPAPRQVELRNVGGGTLASAEWEVDYVHGDDWLKVSRAGEGDAQSLKVEVDGSAYGAVSRDYRAMVTVTVPGAVNSPQVFSVRMISGHGVPATDVVVDDQDAACFASRWYWITPRFRSAWPEGFGGTHHVSSGSEHTESFVRYQPYLMEGRYRVEFVSATQFRPTEDSPKDIRFRVRVRHRDDTETIWVNPLESREIGTFTFPRGEYGYVQIESAEAEGPIVADAVRFHRIGPADGE